MSGQRGYLTQDQTSKIERARRTLLSAPLHPEEDYDKAVKNFVSEVYKSIGVDVPKVYRFASPLACMLALSHLMQIHGQSLLYVLTDFRNGFGSSLRPVVDEDSEAVEAREDPMGTVGNMVTQGLRQPRDEQISDLFEEAFVRQMKERCGGKDRGYASLVKGFKPESISGKDWWSSVAGGGTWIWPYNKFAVACDRPIRADFDERRRCHREDDAAIEFADGYRVWAWHGIIVPKHVILFPQALSFNNVEKETNLETRRIMIERIGAGNYLRQAGAVLEDIDTLTLDGSAPRALMKDKLGNKWLVGTDGSTARVYTMAVPPEAKTCKEAHELICGFEESRLIAEA